MSSIKNVILIGAGGNLGPSVLKELIAAKYNITVLARQSSKSTFPADVKVIKTDYTIDSLVAAFKGQDAVVSTVGFDGPESQKTIIDAAAKAGVKRFIPSEYGSNTQNDKTVGIAQFLQGKREVVGHLKKTNAENPAFTWTSIITGPFFDWGLKVGFLGYDLQKKTAVIYDDGNRRFTVSTLAQIGRSIAGVLARPSETANKYIYVGSLTTTQNEILAALEAATSSKFTVTKRTTETAAKEGGEKLQKGDIGGGFTDLLMAVLYGPGTGNDFEKETDSGLANGVLQLRDEKIDVVVKDLLGSL